MHTCNFCEPARLEGSSSAQHEEMPLPECELVSVARRRLGVLPTSHSGGGIVAE